MFRYRLLPTPEQEQFLRSHCAHARYVWNLAVEQEAWWRSGRKPSPGWAEKCRQLTEARKAEAWLAAGSQMVQQQALRDYDRAIRSFFARTHRKPTWRKAGRNEGFRIVAVRPGRIRRLNRKNGEIHVPKAGWIRFRWSRKVPSGVKSYRVTLDRAGRWHVIFAVAPEATADPRKGKIVGVDRGVTVSVALSTGEMLSVPRMNPSQRRRLVHLQRQFTKAKRGSVRRARTKGAVARLKIREVDTRKDWIEKVTTDLARRFDVIRVEDLKIRNMTRSARGTVAEPGRNVRQKAGLNREILASGWGVLVHRLEQKAPGRVEKIKPHFTSQRCSCCGHVDAKSRESQARFVCTACGYSENADVNAARNIAAGYAVTARGGTGKSSRPVNREPTAA